MRILALDTETGGLTPGRHAAIQIGLAIMEGDNIIASHQQMIGPRYHWKTKKEEREYNVPALAISGLTWKAILAAPKPDAALEHIAEFLRDNGGSPSDLPIVSHNAHFDQGFWNDTVFLAGHYDRKIYKFIPFPEILRGPWYCTRRMAGALDLADGKLDTVAEHYGLSREGDKHSALDDAILAGKCFARMMEDSS